MRNQRGENNKNNTNTTRLYLDVAVEPGPGLGHLQPVVGGVASVVIAPVILYITKAKQALM